MLDQRVRRAGYPLEHARHASAAPHREPAEAVPEIIRDLPIAQQRALVLHDVHGFSTGEIARSLGMPPGTVRSHLARARRRIAGRSHEDRDPG